jgi:hypothetical protein
MEQREMIDRDTYKKIKKMNREELTKFILQYGDELLGEQAKPLISRLLRQNSVKSKVSAVSALMR